MMFDLGHEVFLYAGDENEARATEVINCISRSEQREVLGIESPADNLNFGFKVKGPGWQLMNNRAIAEISKRIQPQDFICLIAGLCQKDIADAYPGHISVEFGIGYSGTFAPFRVFESYAWLHTVYGAQQGADQANGNYFDAVIPNYYEIADFPFSKEQEDFYLFMGRLTDRKGYKVASEVCERMGKRLVIAGQGTPPEYGEYVGLVGPKERGELMSLAKAVFVPTQYLEPFGGVSVEAMLCGTPIITTDWGAFSENNIHGVTGYRCRSLAEYCAAVEKVDGLDRRKIRKYAQERFSTKAVGKQYEKYFTRLLTLWGDGWYTL